MDLTLMGIIVAIVLSLLHLLTTRLHRIEDDVIKWIDYYSPRLSKRPISEIIPIVREWERNPNTENKQKTESNAHLKNYVTTIRDITILKVILGVVVLFLMLMVLNRIL